MPTFAYTARDLTGKQVTGTVEASGEREVTAILSDQSLFPVNVKGRVSTSPPRSSAAIETNPSTRIVLRRSRAVG